MSFDLQAAVAAGIKSGVKCDRCHAEHAGEVALHDWRMDWFAQTTPKTPSVAAKAESTEEE